MRIPKGPSLIEIGPCLLLTYEPKASTQKLIKPQRHKVYRENYTFLIEKKVKIQGPILNND